MTNSQIFKAAHQLAKQFKAIVGRYDVAFKWALGTVYAGIKKAVAVKARAVAFGGTISKAMEIAGACVKRIERALHSAVDSRIAVKYFTFRALGFSHSKAKGKVVSGRCDASVVGAVVDRVYVAFNK